jgi:hypothetical protein
MLFASEEMNKQSEEKMISSEEMLIASEEMNKKSEEKMISS